MPLMNGEVATKEIIKLCYNCNILTIPIFGCTGFSSSEDIQTLISSGMKEVFTKPITKQNLEEILSRLNMGEFKEAFIISPNYQCDNVDLEEKLI
jgi:CheY-like chemotaxis protein